MKAKSVTKFILCILFLGGCVDNTPPKKSTKVKHKETEKLWYDDEDFKKDTLYILWEKQKIYYPDFITELPDYKEKKYFYNDPYYSEEDKSIVFQFSNSTLLFEDGSISDILKIKHLEAYKLSTIKDIDSIDNEWLKKNESILKKIYDSNHWHKKWLVFGPTRNGMYVTYLIKIHDNQKKFTIYPVSWYDPPEMEE